MSLEQKVAERRKEIVTDSYPMSISEFMNLYRDNEIQIHPEFQRFFRWSLAQKSRLIESILLNIPLPSIFVAQREDGVWDVVDGLQRLSTILEFVGDLKAEDGSQIGATVLSGTKYLPELEGATWDDGDNGLGRALQLQFKREKLDFKIIKSQSDSMAKYDLFQRLNTAGSHLSPQELRNCVIIMIDRSMFEWLKTLQQCPEFEASVAMSDRQLDEQYDLELIVRYLVLRHSPPADLAKFKDLGEFLSDKIVDFTTEPAFDREEEFSLFERVFRILSSADEDSPFKRYDASRDRFLGPFSVSTFEVASVGMAENIDLWEAIDAEERPRLLRDRIGSLWTNETFLNGSGSGVPANARINKLYDFTREYLRP